MIKLQLNKFYSVIPQKLQIGKVTLMQDEVIQVLDLFDYRVKFKRMKNDEVVTVEAMAIKMLVEEIGV